MKRECLTTARMRLTPAVAFMRLQKPATRNKRSSNAADSLGPLSSYVVRRNVEDFCGSVLFPMWSYRKRFVCILLHGFPVTDLCFPLVRSFHPLTYCTTPIPFASTGMKSSGKNSWMMRSSSCCTFHLRLLLEMKRCVCRAPWGKSRMSDE